MVAFKRSRSFKRH